MSRRRPAVSSNFDFDTTTTTLSPTSSVFSSQPSPRNWQDVWAYKLGGQYKLNRRLDLRAGYSFDRTPVPDGTVDPLLPDADRHSMAFGLGLHNDFAALDLGYMWVHFVDRSVGSQNMTTLSGENGVFKSDAYLLAANVSFRF